MGDKLEGLLARVKPNEVLPQCPGRKFFGQMDPKFVARRKEELKEYLLQLLATESVAVEGAPGYEILKVFLQAPPA